MAVPSSPTKSILLVDDEPAILIYLRALLSRTYQLSEAETAEEALEFLKTRTFDLIITDKNLPGMSGLVLAREARNRNPNGRVVIITGYQSVASAQEATELGVVDYLVKPFTSMTDLRDRVAAAIDAPNRLVPSPLSKKVLVFEDDPVVAKSIVGALALLGLEADVRAKKVERPREAPHAVVVSWEFAAAPSEQALHLVKSLGVPFIVLTSNPSFDTTIASLRQGALACLPKLTGDERALSRELDRALKGSHQ